MSTQPAKVWSSLIACREDHKAACQQAADRLAAGIARLDGLFQNLSPTAQITLTNESGTARTISGAEARDIWSHVDFKITDPSLTGSLPSGGGGSVTHDANGWHDEFSYTTFSDGSPFVDPSFTNNEGMNFAILHEISHMTAAAQDRHLDDYQNYTESDSTPTQGEWMNSLYFKIDERYANDMAKDLANTLGVPVMPNPVYGYKGQPLG